VKRTIASPSRSIGQRGRMVPLSIAARLEENAAAMEAATPSTLTAVSSDGFACERDILTHGLREPPEARAHHRARRHKRSRGCLEAGGKRQRLPCAQTASRPQPEGAERRREPRRRRAQGYNVRPPAFFMRQGEFRKLSTSLGGAVGLEAPGRARRSNVRRRAFAERPPREREESIARQSRKA
jgi:hypothetical protein